MSYSKTTQAARRMLQALRSMAKKYPYHAEWLAGHRWREEAGVGTMAVSARNNRIRFYYCASFVCECSLPGLQAVIHHELNHLVFGHPFTDPRDYPNRHARVIAEEVTVNEYVPEPLPGSPLTLAEFPELPRREDTHTRYHRLANRTDLADRVRLSDMHSLWSCAPSDSESLVSDLLAVHRGLSGGRGGTLGSLEARHWAMHHSWGLSAGLEVVETLRSAARNVDVLDWKQILAKAAGVRVRREAAFHRPPRRMPHLVGVIPGFSCRTDKPRAMVAIDTSSSMKRPHFERVKAELDRIRELAEVTVVQCDKVVRKSYPLTGSLQSITGRGGTDFRPAFEAKLLSEIRPSLIIYFTDGDGPAPRQPPKVPVIWCLTPRGKSPTTWGRVVRMNA